MKNQRFLLICSFLILPILSVSAGNRNDASKLKLSNILKESQDTTEYYYVKTESTARFFRDMENMSSVIQMIPKDIEVQVFEPIGDYYSAFFDGEYGFLPISKVKPVNFDPEIFKIKPETLTVKQDKYAFLIEKYGQEDADQIFAGKIWKGMTKDMVLDSWGKPKQIDRYIGKTSVKEDWYYNSKVLFIKDGKLVSWK